jgi:outer membrane protein assembly factor BamB
MSAAPAENTRPGTPSPMARVAEAATPVWSVDAEGRGIPVADSTSIYFLTTHHEVVAADRATGRIRWRRETGQPGETTYGSRLVIFGDLVIAGDYGILAFDRNSGALRWRFEPKRGYGAGIYLGPVANGAVLAGSASGHLYAIDAATGQQMWTATIGPDKTTVFRPEVNQGLVVAGFTTFAAPNAGGLIAVDITSGHERWRVHFEPGDDEAAGAGWGGGPVFTGDHIVAASTAGTVHAFSRTGGTLRWSLPAVQRPRLAQLSATADFRPVGVSGETLLVGSLSGRLVAYNLRTRQERWRYSSPVNGAIALSMEADDAFVYIPFVEGCLVAVSIEDGSEQWRSPSDGFHWPPLITTHHVYALSSTRGLAAFRRPNVR